MTPLTTTISTLIEHRHTRVPIKEYLAIFSINSVGLFWNSVDMNLANGGRGGDGEREREREREYTYT